MKHRNQRQVLKIISAIIVMIAFLLLFFSLATDVSKHDLSWFAFLPILFLYGTVEALCSIGWLQRENVALRQSPWKQPSLFQRPPPNAHA
jgi:hypothetical protein